jgi:MFS family permease
MCTLDGLSRRVPDGGDAARVTETPGRPVSLGLAPNWRQFALLVAINAFVGGMAGLERSVLPLLAEDEFGVESATAVLAFIAAFGVTKALANLVAGRLSERFSRRRVLIAGWLLAVPVPLMIIAAPAWWWIVAANLLLGLNQGLAWSMTVNMKMDLAGPSQRGLALGLNEAGGYLAVAAAAFLSGAIAEQYGLRPEPFYLGIIFAAAGLALSVLFVRDTASHVEAEIGGRGASALGLRQAFARATWKDRHLFGISQAGFATNLNDALAWGIFPIFFASQGLSLRRIGVLAALYPLIWGAGQLGTGWLSDILGRRPLIVGGMALQAVAIWLVVALDTYGGWIIAVSLLGAGTAMVYPTLIAAIGDAVQPEERATTVGVYRFWRDTGAMAGALIAGVVTDAISVKWTMHTVAAITLASGVISFLAIGRRSTSEPETLSPASTGWR